MEEDKPYLKSDFKAADLANMLGLTTVKLSQVLNDSLHTKFYDFVNSYRVNEFVELLEKGESEHLTLTAMAELCGFSSKSTFYRAFNNEKGMTPAKFAKTLKENS
jgi:AraC-like DNA-binding protein